MQQIRDFVQQRGWNQFHSPENLAKSVSIESAELLELFQWSNKFDREELKQELADVLIYCLLLADRLEIDPNQAILEKLKLNEEKYPVSKAFGKSDKYDRL